MLPVLQQFGDAYDFKLFFCCLNWGILFVLGLVLLMWYSFLLWLWLSLSNWLPRKTRHWNNLLNVELFCSITDSNIREIPDNFPITTRADVTSYTRSGSGQSTMIVCSVLYGFRRANSKNSVDPVDANNVCSVVMATFSMFIMPSLLLCARNISIVRRSRIRSSFSRCIDYKSHAHHPTTKQLCQPNTVSPLLQKITKHWVCSPVYLVPVPS